VSAGYFFGGLILGLLLGIFITALSAAAARADQGDSER
jgi:hypothetical protein